MDTTVMLVATCEDGGVHAAHFAPERDPDVWRQVEDYLAEGLNVALKHQSEVAVSCACFAS